MITAQYAYSAEEKKRVNVKKERNYSGTNSRNFSCMHVQCEKQSLIILFIMKLTSGFSC